MRATIGLLGLGLFGGLTPTGLPGMTYAAPVLAGAVGALVLLVLGGVAVASFTPRRARPIVRPRPLASTASRRVLNRIASAPSAPPIA
jgi:hypothetical protein